MFKSLPYYIDVATLRWWAKWYDLKDILSPQHLVDQKERYLKSYTNGQTELNIDLSQRPYYFTYGYFMHPRELAHTMKANERGMVINPLSTIENADKPGLLFPAYYGLVCCNAYYSYKDKELLVTIKAHADFIKDHIEEDGSLLIWQDYPLFEEKAPWTNGITQGIAASFLMRAHLLFPSENYLTFARKAIDYMLSKDNGFYITSLDGLPWIEEYPMTKPTMVLNGFVFSIIAVIELGSLTSEEKYKTEAKILVDSLVSSLHRFLYPNGIKHNLYQWKYGNINYQALHTYQFYHLYRVSGHSFFLDLATQYHKRIDWQLFCSFYRISYDSRRFALSDLDRL